MDTKRPQKASNLNDLMIRYAPEVRLHSQEQYLPSSVDWYLPRVSMYFNAGSQGQPLVASSVTLQNLTTQSYTYSEENASKTYSSGQGGQTTGFFLKIKEESTRKGDLSGARCYAHVFTPADDRNAIDIQYMFFFPYNGDIFVIPVTGVHEGDWEHVTVRVKKSDNSIVGIFFSAHDNEGRWWMRKATSKDTHNGYLLNPEGHPVVYSALHSHASYPWAGEFKRYAGSANDYTDDQGPVWKCWENVVEVGTKESPLNGQTWISYTGRWGAVSEMKSDFSGPFTPSFQGWWANDPPAHDPTVIKMFVVETKTGTESPEWYDGPGTNGDVTFTIGRDGLTETWDLDNWLNDRTSGKTDRYELTPKQDFHVYDLKYCTLHHQAVGAFGEDKWNLKHLGVQADGLVLLDQEVNQILGGIESLKLTFPPVLNPLLCVHRGKDHRQLYWCSFDPVTGTWGADNKFTQGNQSDAGPALAVLDGVLYCVHRGGENDQNLFWAMFDPVTYTWSEDRKFTNGNLSKSTPALAVLSTGGTEVLYCVHRGKSDDQYLYWTTFDPKTGMWAKDTKFPGGNQSKVGPGLAVLNVNGVDTLYCVHRGREEDQKLFWTTFDPANKRWASDREFGGGDRSKEDPALAAFRGVLYCVHRGKEGDEKLYWTTFDPATNTWGPDQPFTNGNLSKTGPALAVLSGVLYCVHRGKTDDHNLYWTTFDPDTRTWAKDKKFEHGNMSAEAPAAVFYASTTHRRSV